MLDPIQHTALHKSNPDATFERAAVVEQMLLGRYRVLESRASGGFGMVEVCWDTRLQRRVAIKCLPLAMSPEQNSNSSTMKEALSEARTASLLSHPNIVSVYDFDIDGTYAYLVMEYVDGLTLAELLKRVEGGTLTPAECSHILDKVAEALTFAHENRVLHLDIKPSNIIIDRSGEPRLCDFGMATLASAAGYGDARGGTVGYMSLEQITGAMVDERSDLFSLAVCIVQALCGYNPFAAPTAEDSAECIEKGAIDALAQIQLDCGPKVADALSHALEPDPAYRSSSVKAFADELVPELGDADQGLASLKSLLAQQANDEGAPPQVGGHVLTLAERAPWLAAALKRVLVAGACGWCCALAAPLMAAGSDLLLYMLPLLGAGIGAALPALGSALALLAFIGRCISAAQTSPQTMALAGLIGLLCAAWWWKFGRQQELGIVALVLPGVLGQSFAGVFMGAWGMSATGAAATVALSQLIEVLTFDPTGATLLGPNVLSVVFLLQVAGLSLASLIGAAVSLRPGRSIQSPLVRALIGQGMSWLCAMATLLMCARVENGGIWVSLDAAAASIALLLSVLMCIAAGIFGCSHTRLED